MRFSQFLLRGALCLAVLAGVVNAQSIAVLSGAQGTSTTIPLYSAIPTVNPLAPQGTIDPVPAGAFQVLAVPDGTKFYVLSNANPGITVVPSNFKNQRQIATALQAAPVKGGLSGDGKRLVILTSTAAYLIDTATDQLINSSGFSVNGTPVDVAFSLDSQTAYVVSRTNGTAYVLPIDLAFNTSGTALAVAVTGNSATGITTAPNGLLYLTAQNALIEMTPRPLALTQNGTIPVNGLPGKAQFTKDAATAVALNQTPATGAAMIFDIANRRVTLASNANLAGATLDRLLIANSNRIFVYSSQSRTIYELSLGGGFTESGLRTNIPTTNVGSFIPSNEVDAKTLFVTAVSNGVNTLYQVDIASNALTTQQNLPSSAGQTLAWMGSNPTSGATSISGFNVTQTVAAGGTSLPLVARVVDSQGRPVYGARVDFAATNSATFVGSQGSSSTSTFTGYDGFTQVYVSIPVGGTSSQVTASSAGTATIAYTITVPGSNTGGGTCTSNCSASAMTVVGGNGQLVFEQGLATQLLMVQVKDSSGNPVANQTVVFAVTQGIGTLSCPGIGDQFPYIPNSPCTFDQANLNALDAVTDGKGYAAVKFLASSTFGQSWAQTIVSATSTAGTANFTLNTILASIPNGGGQAPLPGVYLLAPAALPNGYRTITGTAGQTIPSAIQVQVVAVVGPGTGQPIPGVALNVSGSGDATSPSAACANGIPLTDVNGVASCDVVLGGVTTSYAFPLNVNVGGAVSTPLVSIIVNPGLPGKIQVTQGDGQSGKPGTVFTLKAAVTTSSGTPSTGAPVQWAITQGTATLSNQASVTDSQGNAQATITLGSTPGKVVVRLTAGAGSSTTSATFNLTVVPAITVGAITAVSGSGQTATVLQPFGAPLVVKVTDTSGAPVAGTAVTFQASGVIVTFGSAAATTDANGQATTSVTAGANPGTATITASSNGFQTTFTLTLVPMGPSIDATSFRNAASGAQGLSPCGIATVTGAGLAKDIQGTVFGTNYIGPLPYTLANATITVNGIQAPIFWVSNTASGGEAIAFQTPCEITPGPASVIVGYSGGTKTVSGVNVVAFQPALFETIFGGKRYAVLLHASDGSYVTPDNPARRGENLKMFVTGLGPVTPATATNRAGVGGQKPTALITAGLNNAGVPVVAAEYMPGGIGIYTITFTVPNDTQTGDYQVVGLVISDPADPNTPIYANGSFVKVI